MLGFLLHIEMCLHSSYESFCKNDEVLGSFSIIRFHYFPVSTTCTSLDWVLKDSYYK